MEKKQATRKEQERQRTRTKTGQYKKYDTTCELCEKPMSSEDYKQLGSMDLPDRVGFIPAVCDKCYEEHKDKTDDELIELF